MYCECQSSQGGPSLGMPRETVGKKGLDRESELQGGNLHTSGLGDGMEPDV